MVSSKRTRRTVVMVPMMVLALVFALAIPAGAVKGFPLVCQMAGAVNQTQQLDGTWAWDLQITVGQCTGDFSGPYAVFGTGSGVSDTLGLCDGSLVVQNLELNIALFLISSKGPAKNKALSERWGAPITTFPIATPFLVTDPATNDPLGVGAIVTRLGLGCPPAGSPGALLVELRISPS